ncbi:hypothetical protein CEXT_548851 [Caerostris extrusa]|uniref:Uncharacterized protein n=1 Tax=Caerostris extrusa TaxID=172846 RepID=A0AAV4VQH7_CAEEX|nr:hypothetical protein CEXT_548851 [Caerostris extrusa]
MTHFLNLSKILKYFLNAGLAIHVLFQQLISETFFSPGNEPKKKQSAMPKKKSAKDLVNTQVIYSSKDTFLNKSLREEPMEELDYDIDYVHQDVSIMRKKLNQVSS